MHENREASETPAAQPGRRSAGEGLSHKARAYVCEESHSGILPMNHSNKDGTSPAESGEGRPLIKENAGQPNTYPTQSGKGVSQGLAGVRKAARENKEMKFTALLHHLTVDLLRESFHSLKRKAAPGVDGVTWQEYEVGLEDRLIVLSQDYHHEVRAKLSSESLIAGRFAAMYCLAADETTGSNYAMPVRKVSRLQVLQKTKLDATMKAASR